MKKLVTSSKKAFVAMAIIALGIVKLNAQNEPIIAHFMYHTHVFDPAAAGNTRDFHLGALARQQWIGFKEAPSTQLINFYGYVPKIKGGLGAVVVNDMLGKERATSARISYAYSQRMAGGNVYLSLGLSVGLLNVGLKGNELIYQDVNPDQSGHYFAQNGFKPIIGVGLELKAYGLSVGGSVTNLDQSLKKATVFKIPRHYFGYVKYNWDINEKLNFSPGVFVRSSQFTTQADIYLSLMFRKRVTLGFFYRTTEAAGALLGVNITKNIFLSYSYDFDFGELRNHQTGSHELNLMFKFEGKKEKKIFYKSGRYAN